MESDFKEYPKTLAPDDFWGQIKRSVNGQPVSEEQIQLIVATIKDALAFQPGDRLLDLACGNGALSRYFFDDCAEVYGVDYSEVLIEVAKRYFEQLPLRRFDLADVGEYIVAETDPARFTKVLCYGSFPYFPEATARLVLTRLCRDYSQVERVFITAQQLGLPVKLHAEQLSSLHGSSLAARYQALSADHLEFMTEDDAIAMAAAGTVAVLLPGAFYFLRETQLPPIELLRQYGVPTGYQSRVEITLDDVPVSDAQLAQQTAPKPQWCHQAGNEQHHRHGVQHPEIDIAAGEHEP